MERWISNMSGKSNNFSRTQNPDKPFKKGVLEEAAELAREYHIVLEHSERLGFIANSLELPNVYADGRTADACYRAALEAQTVAVAAMLEAGQSPPVPASAKKRTLQVNVRLTPEEKSLLTYASTALGFSGLSDFIRNSALEKVSSSAARLERLLKRSKAS